MIPATCESLYAQSIRRLDGSLLHVCSEHTCNLLSRKAMTDLQAVLISAVFQA